MKSLKKALALLLCIATVVICFAGCSKAEEATEITDETMLIAYTDEKAPFVYTGDDGNLTGFDVAVFKKIFNSVKNDFKNYKFVKVEEGYRIGEDAAYVDDEGNEYVAYVMIGGIQKDVGNVNESYTFSDDVIDNRVITITAKGSSIATYADLAGKNVGVFSDVASAALDKNSAIKNSCKSVKSYTGDLSAAVKELDEGKIDALVVDEFNFGVYSGKDNYAVLPSELDTVNYVYAFKKYDWYVEAINNAIYELQSPDYDDADEFTPIVEEFFGYDASNFDYVPSNTK